MRLVKKLMRKLASNSMDLRKKIRAIETRLIIFYLLRDKKVLCPGSSFSHKYKHLRQQEKYLNQNQINLADSNAIVLDISAATSATTKQLTKEEEQEEVKEDNKCLNLMMFDVLEDVNKLEEDEERNDSLSVKEMEEELRPDDDIDRMADLFIRRFRQQMRSDAKINLL